MKNSANKRASFLVYKSFYEPVKHLKNDELGLVFLALFDYQNGLDVENLPPQIAMAFAFFRNQFDLDDQKYSETCSENARNARVRWERSKNMRTDASACERIRTDANHADKDKDKDKEEDKERGVKLKSFTRPLFEEIKNHVQDNKISVDPVAFFNFYESNGWRVGKNPMKNWKAALANWQTKNTTSTGGYVNKAAEKTRQNLQTIFNTNLS